MLTKSVPDLRLRFLWLSIGYALVFLVVFLSLTGNPVKMGMSFPYEDKVYHAFAYFILMAWFSQIYHDRFQRYVIAVIFVVMGVALECLQSFEPNRYYEFADMIANSTGVALGFFSTLTGAKNILLRIEKVFS